MAEPLTVLKVELLQTLVPQVLELLDTALRQGTPVHHVELEGMNRQMAQDVGWFRDSQGSPPAAEEGALVVITADCKGIVIRGQGTKTACGGQRPAGQRANQKRMATVGAVYTVDP